MEWVRVGSAKRVDLGGWSGGIGFLHNEQAGVVAKRDAVGLEGLEDAAAELAEDTVFLVGADTDVDRVDNFAAVDLIDAEDVGVGDDDVFEGRVGADALGERAEELEDAIGVGGGVHGDGERGDGEVPGEIGDGGDLAVGDDVHGAVAIAEGGGAQGKAIDGAGEAGDADDLTDVELILDEDEDAVEDVLEDGLGAEADANTDDTGGGEQRLDVKAEDKQHLQENDEADEAVGRGAEDAGHGAQLRGSLGVAHLEIGEAAHAVDKEDDKAPENEGEAEDDKETGDIRADEDEQIILPVAPKNAAEGVGGEVGRGLRCRGLEQHHEVSHLARMNRVQAGHLVGETQQPVSWLPGVRCGVRGCGEALGGRWW